MENALNRISDADLRAEQARISVHIERLRSGNTDAGKRGIAEMEKQLELVENELNRRAPVTRKVPGQSPGGYHPAALPGDLDKSAWHYGRSAGTPRGFRDERQAHIAGEWLKAALFGNQRSARWLEDNAPELRVMTAAVNSGGGYLVPTEMQQAIIDNRETYGVAGRVLRVVPMLSDSMDLPVRAGGVTSYYVGETTEITASDASWSNVQLNLKKLATISRLSNDLVESSPIAVADWVAQEAGYAIAVSEDQAMVDGDGSATYGGITGFRTKLTTAGGLTGAVACGSGIDTFAEVTLADIHKLIATCPAYALPNARFVCSQAFKSYVLDRLAMAAGGNAVEQISGSLRPTFFGYPVEISQAMPAGASTDYSDVAMALFGDFNRAGLLGRSESGVRLVVDPSRYLEYDQIAVRATSRFDIVINDVGTASAAGPVVALVGAAG